MLTSGERPTLADIWLSRCYLKSELNEVVGKLVLNLLHNKVVDLLCFSEKRQTLSKLLSLTEQQTNCVSIN